jgi:hypothetical protein
MQVFASILMGLTECTQPTIVCLVVLVNVKSFAKRYWSTCHMMRKEVDLLVIRKNPYYDIFIREYSIGTLIYLTAFDTNNSVPDAKLTRDNDHRHHMMWQDARRSFNGSEEPKLSYCSAIIFSWIFSFTTPFGTNILLPETYFSNSLIEYFSLLWFLSMQLSYLMNTTVSLKIWRNVHRELTHRIGCLHVTYPTWQPVGTDPLSEFPVIAARFEHLEKSHTSLCGGAQRFIAESIFLTVQKWSWCGSVCASIGFQKVVDFRDYQCTQG